MFNTEKIVEALDRVEKQLVHIANCLDALLTISRNTYNELTKENKKPKIKA